MTIHHDDREADDSSNIDPIVSHLASPQSYSELPDNPDCVRLWKDGMPSELDFWDSYFRTKGLEWADSYNMRFDENLPLQERPAGLLPLHSDIFILDVGAGPLTFLGKKCAGKSLHITAVDPLAGEYYRIMDKYDVVPIVRTHKLAAEELTKVFMPDSFDLVVARNCIDHSYNPEKAVLQMLSVVKNGCYVLMEHRENEALNAKFLGLHQWNFSVSEEKDFLISSKHATVNMTRKYSGLCSITCEVIEEPDDGEWLVTRILKK